MFGVTEGCWNIVMYSVTGSIFPAARAMLNGLMMTFYSIGAYVGPAYYRWSLETMGEWSTGLQHMGAVTVVFGLLLIVGFKSKYTDILSFFLGPLMGFLTSTLGHAAALDIIVVAFEAVLVVVAFFMKETQHRAESK